MNVHTVDIAACVKMCSHLLILRSPASSNKLLTDLSNYDTDLQNTIKMSCHLILLIYIANSNSVQM